MLLVMLMAGLFAQVGQPVGTWYCALYAVLSITLVLLMFVGLAWRTQRLLQTLAEQVPMMLRVDPAEEEFGFCRDARVRYLQSVVFQEVGAEKPKAGPLDFIKAELEDWAQSSLGYTVIDSTGVILWINATMCKYFGYERDRILHENIRVLMPNPYSQQHDQFLRNHLTTGRRAVLGMTREVPVLDSRGRQSIAALSVEDRIEPSDAANRLFIGRMAFNQEDLALKEMRAKVESGVCDVLAACSPLDENQDGILVMSIDGTVQFLNKAGCELYGWKLEEIQGKNVKVLMGDALANQHDGFLQRYQERSDASVKTGIPYQSNIVNSGRDVIAKTKQNKSIRIFLMVFRIDRSSRLAKDCLLVGKMVHVSSDDTGSRTSRSGSVHTSEHSSHMTGRTGQPSLKHGSGAYKWHPIGGLRRAKCTVLVMDVHGMSSGSPAKAQGDYEALLSVVFGACTKHRAALQWVVGDRIVVTFNATNLVNTSHRSSCAAFIMHLDKAWKECPVSQAAQLYMAAVARDCQVASWGKQHLLFGDAVDICGALLRAAVETRVTRGLIDASLYDEVRYSYTCRAVNTLTLYPSSQRETSLDVFEVMEMKKSAEDEWMYQIEIQDDGANALVHWEKCWGALLGPASPSRRASCIPQHQEAHVHLLAHLALQPDDSQAQWLDQVLRRKKEAGIPRLIEVSGTVPFVMNYRLLSTETSAAPFPSIPLPPPLGLRSL